MSSIRSDYRVTSSKLKHVNEINSKMESHLHNKHTQIISKHYLPLFHTNGLKHEKRRAVVYQVNLS